MKQIIKIVGTSTAIGAAIGTGVAIGSVIFNDNPPDINYENASDSVIIEALLPFYQIEGLSVELVEDLLYRLEQEEGNIDHVYKDQLGISTIGIGHNLEAHPIPRIISLHLALTDLQPSCNKFAEDWQGYDSTEEHIKAGLCDASFQLGPVGLEGFHETLKDLDERHCQKADQDIRNSKWHRQTENRTDRLISLIEDYCK